MQRNSWWRHLGQDHWHVRTSCNLQRSCTPFSWQIIENTQNECVETECQLTPPALMWLAWSTPPPELVGPWPCSKEQGDVEMEPPSAGSSWLCVAFTMPPGGLDDTVQLLTVHKHGYWLKITWAYLLIYITLLLEIISYYHIVQDVKVGFLSDLLAPGELGAGCIDSIAAGPGGDIPVHPSWPENICTAPGLRFSDRDTSRENKKTGVNKEKLTTRKTWRETICQIFVRLELENGSPYFYYTEINDGYIFKHFSFCFTQKESHTSLKHDGEWTITWFRFLYELFP